YNYLGSNETARQIFPELNTLTVDRSIRYNPTMKKYAVAWLDKFRADDKNDKFHYTKGEKIYLIDINYLVDGRNKRGYQFFITDDTKDQKYINLMNKFNTSLQEQVTRKTNHIVEMHNNLIMSMATMVESRDNSTGGHIKRTSECVRILIDEIKKNNVFNLSEDFCKNIIKAAPMHDLGKIAVDDAVLRKPGRFEPEEFEKMKHHAAEGARIVKEILKATDDADFRIVAENVAHYHHERWDGSGYPEGLKEEHIPLEARIMAIADVYDALVSKRVYKESMSFEKADSIIMEGMGKHFDEKLKPFYIKARPKLEAYYKKMNKEK
ncbi:MAG: HD domain-containing protein, partial [Lachnospiraceae bacterium]|nr:HD domain-containing protein [Lachnospiraceae bacterium]